MEYNNNTQNGQTSNSGSCTGSLYTIQGGDTLYKLSRKYNIPLQAIMNANPNVNVYNLQVGQQVCIPMMGNVNTRPSTRPEMTNNNTMINRPVQQTRPARNNAVMNKNKNDMFENYECPACPEQEACPTCPAQRPCPECEECPEEKICPTCPAQKECPVQRPCPTCPAQKECPAQRPCPTCPVCKECPPERECPTCPDCPECPACPTCPTCPVCKECPPQKPCPAQKPCPSCPKQEPCPDCPECTNETHIIYMKPTVEIDIDADLMYEREEKMEDDMDCKMKKKTCCDKKCKYEDEAAESEYSCRKEFKRTSCNRCAQRAAENCGYEEEQEETMSCNKCKRCNKMSEVYDTDYMDYNKNMYQGCFRKAYTR